MTLSPARAALVAVTLALCAFAIAQRPGRAAPPDVGPEGGWIWQHAPLERLGERSMRDDGDVALLEEVSRYRRRHVIDDARIDLRVPGELEDLIRAATALQLLELRGRLDGPGAAVAREIAFHLHGVGLAASQGERAGEVLQGLLKWRLPDLAREVTSEGVASLLRAHGGRWFLRLHAGVTLTPTEHLRSGRFAASEGAYVEASQAFVASWEGDQGRRAALLAQEAMIAAALPDSSVRAFEARATAVEPRLAGAFEAQRRDLADGAANAAWLKTRAPLPVAEAATRALALARLGQVDEALRLANETRYRHEGDPVAWRLAALLRSSRGDRDNLREFYGEAAEEGLMKDARLREGRLLLLVDGSAPEALERELTWLAKRSPRDALLAEIGRGLPLLARAAAARGTPQAATASAPLRAHLESVVTRYPGETDAWALAVAGFGAMRALETESATLRGWLAKAPAEVRETVEGWLVALDAAFAVRARDKAAIRASLEVLEARATSGERSPTEQLLLAATRFLDTELSGWRHTSESLAKVREVLEGVLMRADPMTHPLERHAALAGLATTWTVEGRAAEAASAWRAVRGAEGSPFLAAMGTAWQMRVSGDRKYAALRFLDARDAAEDPHEHHYTLFAALDGLREDGQTEILGKIMSAADEVARAGGLAVSAIPIAGPRAVLVSRISLSLQTPWEMPLTASVNLDPVVALLPSP